MEITKFSFQKISKIQKALIELYYIKLKNKISKSRDKIISLLLKNGIEARNCFYQ